MLESANGVAKYGSSKMPCYLDEENHCFVLALPPSGTTNLSAVFRSIISAGAASWKELAVFCGFNKASIAFNIAYKKKPTDTITMLNEYLVIDEDTNQARLYDIDHKPDGAPAEHVGPTIVNGEPKTTNIYTKVPSKVTSRLMIKDPLQRMLVMVLRPIGGYLLGINDVHIAADNMVYSVTGTPKTLNKLLKTIYFVGTTAGDGSVVISVDDKAGASSSVSSTTVTFKIQQTTEVSTPEINLPEDQMGNIGEYTEIDPITITDDDNKEMEVRFTPFNCSILGFKNSPFPVDSNDPQSSMVLNGRPDTINNYIENLSVKPYAEVCHIGIELKCQAIFLRKYLEITGIENEEGDKEIEEEKKEQEPTLEDIENKIASEEADVQSQDNPDFQGTQAEQPNIQPIRIPVKNQESETKDEE